MAIFASTTLGTSDPSRAMSIKALEARAQALAAAQAKQEMPTSMPSPWQGAGYLTNTVADALAAKRADQAAGARRQELASVMSGIGPEGPTPQQQAQITGADPELGRLYATQAFTARQNAAEIAARKEAAAEKYKQDEAAAVSQEQRVQSRPQTDPGKIKADLAAGRLSQEEADAALKKLSAPPAAEQKLIDEKVNEHVELQSTAAQLAEAQQLLDKGVYSGAGAGLKTDYGQIAAAGKLGGITGTDPETTARSKRYSQIMSQEVLTRLSKLKGPSSDKDMAWAAATVNDASAPVENKKRALSILQAQANAHMGATEQTLKSLGGSPVKVDIPPTGASAPTASAAGGNDAAARAWLAANPNDPRAEAVRKKLGGG